MTMPTDVKLDAEGVVKPLEWRPIGRSSEAQTPLGSYYAQYYAENDGSVWTAVYSGSEYSGADELGDFATADAAKAAVQADYGQRILSCLTPEALAALDNSKPTPAVGDDGLIERMRAAVALAERMGVRGDHPTNSYQLLDEAATALVAAHSQHAADVARIAELAEALSRLVDITYADITYTDHVGDRWSTRAAALARSALAKVKP